MTIDTLKPDIKSQVDTVFANTQALYHHLHEHPELSFAEQQTSQTLAKKLAEIGYEVTTGVGKTGVVAVLDNPNQGGDNDSDANTTPVIMLRADMDALPIKEQTQLEFASQAVSDHNGQPTPVMHACGHDLHSSCLVGAAEVLYQLKDKWSGKLILVCQPAEEIFGGAKAMLADDLYQRFGRPDVILGQHNMPALAGTVGMRSGVMMAACTNLAVTIYGVGGHGSMPENTIDPVVIAAHVVTRLQTIVSREVPSFEAVVITVGKLHAGTQANIIPDFAELEINIRSFNDQIHQQVVASIERIIQAECVAGNTPKPADIRVLNETISVDNDEAVFDNVGAAYRQYFGEDKLYQVQRVSGSEDFPYYGNAQAGGFDGDNIPSLYWLIGSTDPQRWAQTEGDTLAEKQRHLEMPHSPFYFPGNPITLRTGIETLVVAALSYLG